MGIHQSLQLFVNDIPNLIVMKYSCHSLALFLECEKPDELEIIIREVYNHLQYSYKK